MFWVNLLFLLIITVICTVFAVCLARKKEIKKLGRPDLFTSVSFGKTTRIILIILILFFTALRVFRFGTIPGGVHMDGAMAAVDGKALATYGTDRFGTKLPAHFYAWGFGQMSVLSSYCMIPFIKLFGLNTVTMRLPILIASILGTVAVFFIVRSLLSLDAGLVAALMVAVNPWHFMQSRWEIDCNMFPHMFIVGLVFLISGLRKRPLIFVSMLFFALCMYSYGVSFYMVPVFLLTAAIVLIRLKLVKVWQVLCAAALYFLVSFPIYGTIFINALGKETISLPFVTMQYFPDSVRSNDMLLFCKDPGKQFFLNIRSYIEVVILQKSDYRIWNSIEDFGTLYLCSIPLVITGFGICSYKAFKEKDTITKAINILLLAYAVCSFLTGILINDVNINRINIVHYLSIIFMSVGIYHLISWKKMFTFIISTIYGVLCLVFFLFYFSVWPARIKVWFNADFLEALAYADTIDFDKCYITPDTQYDGSANVSEILTLFALDIDAEYFQGKTDAFDNRNIPYKERYIYSNPVEKKPGNDGNTVYIMRIENLGGYDFSNRTYKDFGRFRVYLPD